MARLATIFSLVVQLIHGNILLTKKIRNLVFLSSINLKLVSPNGGKYKLLLCLSSSFFWSNSAPGFHIWECQISIKWAIRNIKFYAPWISHQVNWLSLEISETCLPLINVNTTQTAQPLRWLSDMFMRKTYCQRDTDWATRLERLTDWKLKALWERQSSGWKAVRYLKWKTFKSRSQKVRIT